MNGLQEKPTLGDVPIVNQSIGIEKSGNDIPYGYCHCGCGQKTTISTCTNRKRGRSKGHPMRYIRYHQCKTGLNKKDNPFSTGHTLSLYRVWDTMKGRCYNPNHAKYKYYGARGILVCDRWKYSFENFYNDMGMPPYKHSIDRINNDGNYEPTNCRWATYKEQANNKRAAGTCL
jgi:hypothetical protein